jgi:hypothetical protein
LTVSTGSCSEFGPVPVALDFLGVEARHLL